MKLKADAPGSKILEKSVHICECVCQLGQQTPFLLFMFCLEVLWNNPKGLEHIVQANYH